MRIDEFRVIRYGRPLSDSGKISPKKFDLIFGENEDGKSLTIDALVKLMLGEMSSEFKNINRVDEEPEGYVVVRDSTGKEVTLPQKGTLTKFTGLSPSECENIFIIRNSDLSIASEEGDFYVNVADKLVGLRAKQINNIQTALRNLVKITPSNTFKDGRDEKLKSRMDKAQGLVNTIDELLERAKEENIKKFEIESVNVEDARKTTELKLALLEDARKRELYEKGQASLTKMEGYLSNIDKVAVFSKEDSETWRDAHRDKEKLEDERKSLKEELSNLKIELSNETDRADTAQKTFNSLQTKKVRIDDEIKPALKSYEKEREATINQAGNRKLLSLLAPLSTIIVICSLLGVLITNSLFFYAFSGVSGFFTLAVWVIRFRYTSNMSKIDVMFDSIRRNAAQYGLDGESEGIILEHIENYEENLQVESTNLQSFLTKKQTLQSKVEDLEKKKIPNLETQEKNLESKIEAIKTKSSSNTLEDYVKGLNQKLELDNTIAQEEKALESLFGKKGQNMQDRMRNWGEQVKDLSEFKEGAKDTKYDEQEVKTTNQQLTALKVTEQEINEKLTAFQEELPAIEQLANTILRTEEQIYCRCSTDLVGVKKALEAFMIFNSSNRDNAIEAIEIFEQIGNEEKSKVTDLFGRNSKISNIFKTITAGRYVAVNFNSTSGLITVETKDGDTLAVDKLSAGAYDQLYLSIRLALGEKLLKGDKGFFIMDDPFIKADSKRLRRQLEILNGISDSGWQIIYFTAKDEVKEALQEQIKAGTVNLIEINKIA